MTSYTHLTIREREMIFFYHGFGFTIRRIGRLIKRSPSTVMRELRRNTTKFKAIRLLKHKNRIVGISKNVEERESWINHHIKKPFVNYFLKTNGLQNK